MFQQLLTQLMDLLLPRRCLGCLRYDTWACEPCVQRHQLHQVVTWPHQDLAAVHSLGPYHDPFWRQLVELLKFHGVRELAQPLGQALAGLAEAATQAQASVVVIPVPLHPSRQRERGFNQAGLLAEVMSRLTGLPTVDDLLVRQRATPAQARLGDSVRQANVAGAFALVDPVRARRVLTGQTVYLIDDVYTTGATSAAAAQALLGAGCVRIEVFAVARGR